MTRVILVDPRVEIIIHSVQIYNKESKHRADDYFKREAISRGYNLERILIREGLITIMDPRDEIPIPVDVPLVRRT